MSDHCLTPLALAALALGALHSTAAAQARDQVRPFAITAALDVNTLTRKHRVGQPAEGAQLGVEWRQRRSGAGLRAELTYHRQWLGWNGASGAPGECEGCFTSLGRRESGLTVSGFYELRRFPVRPYALTGVGLYHQRDYRRTNITCREGDPMRQWCTPTRGDEQLAESRGWLGGLSTGAGLAVALGRTSLYSEIRYFQMHGESRLHDNINVPIVFGVRY